MLGRLTCDVSAPGVLAETLPNASGSAGASFQLKNDGTYAITGQSAANWVTPATSTIAAFYQVSLHVTAGVIDGVDAGQDTYLDLSTTRTWGVGEGGSATVTVTIREKFTSVVRKVYAGITLTDTA